MQEPTKEEVIDYVADMAEQLAVLSEEHIPPVAVMLRNAAKLAEGAMPQNRDL